MRLNSLKKTYEFITLNNSKNCYLLSRSPKLTSLVNPELECQVKKGSISAYSECLSDELDSYSEYSAKWPEIPYYTALYMFLKQHGFFNSNPVEPFQQFDLSPEEIQNHIASTENIVFEVTERCDLECVYCGFGKLYEIPLKRGKNDLQFKIAKNLLDFVWSQREKKRISHPLYISFYGGEPLLNFNLINQIIQYIKNSETIDDKSIKYRITTNGILLEKYINTLIANDIYLTISLDGDKIHNRYRKFPNGVESFDSVYSQCLILRQKNPLYFKRRVNFNSILTDISNLKEIELFFRKNFRKPLKISELSLIGVKKEKYNQFRKMYRTIAQSFRDCMANNKFLKNHPISLRLFNILVSHSDYFIFHSDFNRCGNQEVFIINTGTCKPFQKKIFCTVDGNLLPCEKVPRNFFLAKVNEKSVEIDYNHLSQLFIKWNNSIAEMCMNCFDGLNCLNCLFFMDFSSKKPICDRFCSHDSYIKKLQEIFDLLEINPDFYKSLFERS